MDCASQVGVGIYPSKTQIYDSIRQGRIVFPKDYGDLITPDGPSLGNLPVDSKIAIAYSEFGCFFEYLRNSFGNTLLHAYIKLLSKRTWFFENASFQSAFSVSLDSCFESFIKEVRISKAGSYN